MSNFFLVYLFFQTMQQFSVLQSNIFLLKIESIYNINNDSMTLHNICMSIRMHAIRKGIQLFISHNPRKLLICRKSLIATKQNFMYYPSHTVHLIVINRAKRRVSQMENGSRVIHNYFMTICSHCFCFWQYNHSFDLKKCLLLLTINK